LITSGARGFKFGAGMSVDRSNSQPMDDKPPLKRVRSWSCDPFF